MVQVTYVAHDGAETTIDATEGDAEIAGRYLTEELVDEQPHFCTNTDAIGLREALLAHIERSQVRVEGPGILDAMFGGDRGRKRGSG